MLKAFRAMSMPGSGTVLCYCVRSMTVYHSSYLMDRFVFICENYLHDKVNEIICNHRDHKSFLSVRRYFTYGCISFFPCGFADKRAPLTLFFSRKPQSTMGRQNSTLRSHARFALRTEARHAMGVCRATPGPDCTAVIKGAARARAGEIV